MFYKVYSHKYIFKVGQTISNKPCSKSEDCCINKVLGRLRYSIGKSIERGLFQSFSDKRLYINDLQKRKNRHCLGDSQTSGIKFSSNPAHSPKHNKSVHNTHTHKKSLLDPKSPWLHDTEPPLGQKAMKSLILSYVQLNPLPLLL